MDNIYDLLVNDRDLSISDVDIVILDDNNNLRNSVSYATFFHESYTRASKILTRQLVDLEKNPIT
jgi:hypothetical protein